MRRFKLPGTEVISREVLLLPMHPEISDEQAGYVIESIHNFYRD
ncbi:MAG TPA: hypothetical protein VMW45_00950 [Dehalococcoidia bacterium]|nr:hypothetical protein [Dehalococcoidia bacterium]